MTRTKITRSQTQTNFLMFSLLRNLKENSRQVLKHKSVNKIFIMYKSVS